jgi:membrane protein required for beta-lactamase induction
MWRGWQWGRAREEAIGAAALFGAPRKSFATSFAACHSYAERLGYIAKLAQRHDCAAIEELDDIVHATSDELSFAARVAFTYVADRIEGEG